MGVPWFDSELGHRIRVKVKNDGFGGLMKAIPRATLGTALAYPLKRWSDDAFVDLRDVRNDPDVATDVTWLGESRTVTYENPLREEMGRPESVCFPRPFVAEFRGVSVFGSKGIKRFADGRVLLDDTADRMGKRRLYDGIHGTVRQEGVRAVHSLAPLVAGSSGRVPQIADVAFSMVGPLADTYYHWTLEYLPRLQLFEAYRSMTNEEPKLLVPADPPRFVTESLELLGYDPSKHVPWAGGRGSVGRFLCPSSIRHETDVATPSPAGCAWLRDRMVESVDVEKFEPSPERIYLSRQDTDERRVENESTVVDILEDYGFETVVPSEHPLAEQVAWFSQAEAVVGPHGGGLTNTIYGDDLTVVEMFGDRLLRHYFDIAAVQGFDYHAVRGRTVDGIDIHVDADELVETLTEAGLTPV